MWLPRAPDLKAVFMKHLSNNKNKMCDLRGELQRKVDAGEVSCMPNAIQHVWSFFMSSMDGLSRVINHLDYARYVKCTTLDMVFEVQPCTTNPCYMIWCASTSDQGGWSCQFGCQRSQEDRDLHAIPDSFQYEVALIDPSNPIFDDAVWIFPAM